MAQLIPGFTESESVIIDRAAKRGLLTLEYKRQIADRVLENAQAENAKPPSSVEQVTGGLVSKSRAEAVGEVGGLALGSTGGPIGGFAGAVGGKMIGNQVFETSEELLNFLGVIQSGKTGELDPREALASGAEGAAFELGALGAGRVLKPLGGWALGLTGEGTKQLIQKAKQAGLVIDREGLVAVGAIDAVTGTRGEFVKGVARVLGVFPLISGPLRSNQRKKLAVMDEAAQKLLAIDNYAPTAHIGEDLGIDMVKASRESFDEFKGVAGELYEKARDLARQTNKPFIPTVGRQMLAVESPRGIKDVAEEFLAAYKQGTVELADGTILKGPDDTMAEYLESLTKLPDALTASQYERVIGDMKTFLNKAKMDGFDVKRLAQLKEGLENGLSHMRTDLVEGGEEIKKAFQIADEYFGTNIVRFQSATGKKLARADKNIFGAGPQIAGTLEEDQVSKVMLNLKSGEAIKNLRALVGDKMVARAGRNFFQAASDSAAKLSKTGDRIGTDWNKFSEAVGLTGDKVSRAALREMLDASGSKLSDLEAIVDVAKRTFVPLDMSEYLKRRLTLGGGAAVATLFKFAGATSGISSLAVGAMMWRAGAVISNPGSLKAMRRILDTRTSDNTKRLLLGALLDAHFTPEGDLRKGANQAADIANEQIQELKQRGTDMMNEAQF